MSQEKQISMSDLRKVTKSHIENLRVTELTRLFLRREFDKLLTVIEAAAKKP